MPGITRAAEANPAVMTAHHPPGYVPRAARWLTPALLGVPLGTLAQLQQTSLFLWPVYMAIGLLALVFIAQAAIKKEATGWRFPALTVAFAALVFGLVGVRALVFASGALDSALEGRDLRLTGVVAAMPQQSEDSVRFRFAVASAHDGERPVQVPAQIYLSWYRGAFVGETDRVQLQRQPAALRAGELWSLTVRLKAPHGASNPQGFDYELWLWEQGLQATGYVRAGAHDAPAQRLSQSWHHPVELARQHVRERIEAQVPQRQLAGLIAALVVGDQTAIERADWDVFRATGVAHLMSISGLHVTMLAWLAALLVGWCWRRSPRLCLALAAPHAALLGAMLLAGAYAAFSGWGVPAQRTVLMLLVVGLLRLSGRQWPWPLVWLAACAAVLLADPWAMLQAGFWLSFVAVAVLFAADPGVPGRQRAGLAGKFAAGLREQWVITLALTPLTLLLFGQVSVVGLGANVLAIPWVTLVITPLAMLGVLLPWLWDLAAWAAGLMLAGLSWLAALPWASLLVAQAPGWLALAGVLGGVVLALRLPLSLRLLGVPLMLPVLLWQAPRPQPGQFELLGADIGQGNAVLVRTASHALLYDAGPRFSRESDAGHRVLVPLLRALDERLNMLVLSHRDADHVGGAPAVLAMQPQASLLSSVEDGHELGTLRQITRCMAGQHWRWDGVDFEVLHPLPADYAAPGKSNAMSCVLRISNGAQTALLAGDIEAAQEGALLARGAALKADWLLVPHHGSKTSSSPAFLDGVAPRIAWVQSGYRNRFGHPAQPVLERYTGRGIVVFDSPHCGAARWHSAQPGQVACQRDLGRRYWHHVVP